MVKVKFTVVPGDFFVDDGIHVLEDGAPQSVGDGRDEVLQLSVLFQHLPHVCSNFLFRSVAPVDLGPHAAHDDHAAVQMAHHLRNVVLRQDALPALNADFHHIVQNRHQVGIGVVDGDASRIPNLSVKLPVRFFKEFPPDFRLHEQLVFRAPVVVGEDDVRLQSLDQHPNELQSVLKDVVDQLVHFLWVLVEVGQSVLEAHQEVALLKDSGSHKTRQKALISRFFPLDLSEFFPALLAVVSDIRCVDHLFPPGDVLQHCGLFRMVRDGARGILRKQNGHAPPVFGAGSPNLSFPKVPVHRISQSHLQGFVLVQQALRPSIFL